jgi:hypothetical protein
LAVHLDRRFFYIPGNVKLFGSPGKAGGLPILFKGNTSTQKLSLFSKETGLNPSMSVIDGLTNIG